MNWVNASTGLYGGRSGSARPTRMGNRLCRQRGVLLRLDLIGGSGHPACVIVEINRRVRGDPEIRTVC